MERESKAKKRNLGREAATLAITVVALFAALLFALRSINGFAWFANNKEVSAAGMSTRITEDVLFELAAITPEPEADPAPSPTETPDVYDFLGTLGYEFLDMTSSGHAGLVVYLKNEVRNDDAEEGMDPYMLRPGSHGTIEFFVIPKEENLKIKFHLNVRATGLSATPAFLEDGTAAADIIKGHILFFEGYESQKYSGLITDESELVLNTQTAQSETFTVGGTQYTGYRMTIYWIWPRTLGSIVLPDGHPSLYVFGSSLFDFDGNDVNDVEGTIFETMREYVADNWTFFFSESVDHEGPPTDFASLAANIVNNFARLSDGYNNGDQLIGDAVDYLVVEITAEAAAMYD